MDYYWQKIQKHYTYTIKKLKNNSKNQTIQLEIF